MMTIRYPKKFKESKTPWFEGVFDWDFLLREPSVFPRGIQPMDIDAIVEIEGHFIAYESKSVGKTVSDGQQKCLRQLARKNGFVIITVWMDKKTPKSWDWRVLNPSKNTIYHSPIRYGHSDMSNDLRSFVRKWVEEASKGSDASFYKTMREWEEENPAPHTSMTIKEVVHVD